MTNDLYIWLSAIIIFAFGSVLIFFWLKKFEIAFLFFALSPFITPLFYENIPAIEIVGGSPESPGIGGYTRAIILLLLGIVGIITYIKNFSKLNGKIPTHLLGLAIFVFFSFISSLYSLDPNLTLTRSLLLFSVFGFLLGFNSWLQEKGNINKALNILFIIVTISIFVTIIGLFALPARTWWHKSPRLIGFWEHPNNLGAFCMLVYPIIFWKFYNIRNPKKYFILLILFLNILLHILSGSRSTLIASLLGITIWLLLEKNWIKLFFIVLILGISFITLVYFSPSSFYREEGSKITDLSSRDSIWKGAFIFVKDHPFIGYGYGVEGEIFKDESKIDLEGSFIEKDAHQSMHNGYLSVVVNLGLLGLFLWLFVLFIPLSIALPIPFNEIKAYSVVTISMVLITNFTESNITGYSTATDIYFWIAWIIAGNLKLNSIKQTSLDYKVNSV